MGKQLEAKFDGSCPDCGASWKKGTPILYDKFITNSKGKSFACTDVECASEHGVKTELRATYPAKSYSVSGDRFLSSNREVAAVLPDVPIDSKMVNASITVRSAVLVAQEIAEKMYPQLPKDSQTFGQIRSKFVDQLIRVYTHAQL